MCPSKMTVRTNNGSAAKQSLRVASSGWSAQLMKMNGNTKNITVFTNAKTQPSSFCTTESFTTSDSAQPPIAGAKITHALPRRKLRRPAGCSLSVPEKSKSFVWTAADDLAAQRRHVISEIYIEGVDAIDFRTRKS